MVPDDGALHSVIMESGFTLYGILWRNLEPGRWGSVMAIGQ